MKPRPPRNVSQHQDGAPRAPEQPHSRRVIAEDEPPIAAALQRELAKAWPALQIVATVVNGLDAIERIKALQPDVAFLDISMPGATGLDVARACAKLAAPPQIVFVTAYDEYALDAFDAAAIDYLLKPVDPARLARTVDRLRECLRARPRQADAAAERTCMRICNASSVNWSRSRATCKRRTARRDTRTECAVTLPARIQRQ